MSESKTPRWDALMARIYARTFGRAEPEGILPGHRFMPRGPYTDAQRETWIAEMMSFARCHTVTVRDAVACFEVPVPVFLDHVTNEEILDLRYDCGCLIGAVIERAGRTDSEAFVALRRELDEFRKRLARLPSRSRDVDPPADEDGGAA
ncbi:hypothetical protein [Methylosinus sp. Sm6]|uniref:hypothetical protein n=1 Tax=Methylosinus sp. Sm6 TaxID=2866948 RepID=UPI001C9953C8|nr:hypothetical protein [Methylosinus sp. Sm6]MBY6239835.1 hypothetical protein [Methylosinus sp. Sm6]